MEVSPFRGIRYDARIAGDPAVVVCPPYDVIPPERQRLYYEASRYNAIRLEHPLEEDSAAGGGSGATDKYAGAAATFRRWLDDGALFVEEEPAFYVHDQYYLYGGEEMVRRGLLARVRLEPWGVGVRPHEETFPKAKDDRLKLMRACRANFSPLLSLYSDPEGAIGATLSDVTRGEAAVELEPGVDNALDPGERHLLWAATGAEVHRRIGELFSELPLFMADGHHRYETALAYQRERVASQGRGAGAAPGAAGFDYVMMELVEFSDPGLVILPIHRVVEGVESSALADLEDRLPTLFSVDAVPLSGELRAALVDSAGEPDIRGSANTCLSRALHGAVVGILGLKENALLVLRRREGVQLDEMMPAGRRQEYRDFAVSILNHVILDRLLGFVGSKEEISYTVDVRQAWQQVQEGSAQLAFILTPPEPTMVRSLISAGERMPGKSTYFYPKLPSGLVINSLD